MNRFWRILLLTLGTLSVILGAVGIFIPILPTTPFLLLAAYFYVRSSQRFYHWLICNRWFGKYIRNYREGRGIPLKHKIITLALLYLSIGYAAGFVVDPWWGKLLLVGVAAGVTVHLVRVRNYKPETTGVGKQPSECDESARVRPSEWFS